MSVNPGRTFTERPAEGMAAEARQQGVSVGRCSKAKFEPAARSRFARNSEEIADAVVHSSPQPAPATTPLAMMALTPMVRR